MPDVEALLRRQSDWQRARRALPWPEKVRLAEQLRDSVAALRLSRPEGAQINLGLTCASAQAAQHGGGVDDGDAVAGGDGYFEFGDEQRAARG